jgi:hypothetical protein
MAGIGLIAAVMIFLWLKNKQENRTVGRHSRLAEKQEALIEMLREKNKKGNDEES